MPTLPLQQQIRFARVSSGARIARARGGRVGGPLLVRSDPHFRCLHAHGPITKIPRPRRWRVTRYGRKVMGTTMDAREHHFPNVYAGVVHLTSSRKTEKSQQENRCSCSVRTRCPGAASSASRGQGMSGGRHRRHRRAASRRPRQAGKRRIAGLGQGSVQGRDSRCLAPKVLGAATAMQRQPGLRGSRRPGLWGRCSRTGRRRMRRTNPPPDNELPSGTRNCRKAPSFTRTSCGGEWRADPADRAAACLTWQVRECSPVHLPRHRCR